MKIKRIKVTKETLSKEVVELKEEDLDKVAGGEIGVNEKYITDEEDRTDEGYITAAGQGICRGCGRRVKSVEVYSIKGFCCPYCGYFNS